MSISTAFVESKVWYTQCINTNVIIALRGLRIRITHIFVQTDWTTELFGNTRFKTSLLSHSGLIQMSISNNHQLFWSICPILPISVRITSLTLEQTYDWPSVSQRILRNVDTFTSGVTPVISVYCFWISRKSSENQINAIYLLPDTMTSHPVRMDGRDMKTKRSMM